MNKQGIENPFTEISAKIYKQTQASGKIIAKTPKSHTERGENLRKTIRMFNNQIKDQEILVKIDDISLAIVKE